MTANRRKNMMYLRKSASGKGAFLVTPSGVKNIYCGWTELAAFVAGEIDHVDFTMGVRDKPVQSMLSDTMEEIQDG